MSARQKNNQPKVEPSTGVGEHALSDIHAAMMEELGIGRKDTLPLQDTRQTFPEHTKVQFTLNPKDHAPGVNTWRNAVFDDVDPAEEGIDSIADGQLARIRRRLLNNDYPEPLLGRNRNSNLDKGLSSHMKNDGDLLLGRRKDVGRDQALSRNIPTHQNNSSQPQTTASRGKRNKVDKNRLNSSIARLRSSIPPAPTHTSKDPTSTSTEPSLKKQKSPKGKGPPSKGKNPSQRLKPHPTRPTLPRSAWGALDENAFLAYAIRPPSPVSSYEQSYQSQLTSVLSSNSLESSTTSYEKSLEDKLITNNSKSKENSFSAINTLDSRKAPEINQEVLTPLIHDMDLVSSGNFPTTMVQEPNQKESESPLVSTSSLSVNLVETVPQNPTDVVSNSDSNFWINLEGRAMVQMNEGLGLPGYARLRGEPGSLFLELQQSDRIVACESLSNDVVLFTDTMNPKFNLAFQALKKQTQPNTIWRISFEFTHIKSEFLRIISNFRAEGLKNNLLQISYTDRQRSILDTLDHKTAPFYTSLIHIGTINIQENTMQNNAQIKTETLNDLSEIGGISSLSISDKAT